MKRSASLVVAALLSFGMEAAAAIPVTSYQVDVGDDPENNYSGAPRFDWSFFGNQTRIITKYPANLPAHRNSLGIDYSMYWLESRKFNFPPSTAIQNAIQSPPVIPVVQFASIGKINRTNEDGEKAIAQDLASIDGFKSHYGNLQFGGGQTSEVDGDFAWLYSQYYGRLPVGPGGRSFPSAYQDFIESNLKRSSVPYMMQQHNQGWGTHYVAKERAMSMGGPQLFYRGTANIVTNLVTARSAARQYPHPLAVQFSGQPILSVSNASQVLNDGAEPIYDIAVGAFGPNYGKSYALNRQAFYLSWLNGARTFNWESGEFISSVASGFPSPLGTFTKRANDLVASVGPVGPVQTPVAIISEFSNAWQPPEVLNNGNINFLIGGDAPYAAGDYQLQGIRDHFYPNSLQCEKVYEASMGEDDALCPTPYGNSIDFLMSDVRPEALQRYGLLVWGGVPPEAPSMVRKKLMSYLNESKGRVVLFGAAARGMFPEWFEETPPTVVGPGAVVSYGGLTMTETSDFSLEHLRTGLDVAALSMKVLATVGDDPLVVECQNGLILVLSDYGTNRTQLVSPTSARWYDNQLVTEIPHQLLKHASRILQDEASRSCLFSVGNDKLHYVVTRPRAGEFLVGIFNDKLTSETFSISSNIGLVTSLEEVPLNDNQQELKHAAGGAAYAPPGLRTSPALPLDYGLSDASHIEGRDFRLFRIHLAEDGVREVPSFHFPERPAGRVLAVAGLEPIRRYLQGMPSFFQWFDGIKVDADDLLSIDDGWLTEQAHWLNRRGVRVVVNGEGIDEAKGLLVLAKLALIHSGAKDLIISSPSGAIQAEANNQGVRLLTSAQVNRIYRKGEHFNPSAVLNIIDLHYRNEEDLSRDLRHFEFGEVVATLRGKQRSDDLRTPLSVTGDVSDAFFYVGPYIHSLTGLLLKDPIEFAKFRGVKIDSTYLLSKTTAELAKDAATLAQMGLEVVVDLRRDQMHHDRIALYPHIPNYESGILLYTEIVSKMQTLGASDLILRLQDVGGMRNNAAYIAQRDATWNTFADLALTRNIKLHLIFSPSLSFSSTNGFLKSNVFVIEGGKGTASAFKLVRKDGTTGNGSVSIYDDDSGLYASGVFETAQVEPLTFGDWATSHGVEASTVDTDKDGVCNLMEFALGGDPVDAQSSGYSPTLTWSSSGPSFVYPRRKNSGLTYWLMTSTDLVTWAHSRFVENPETDPLDGEFEAVANQIQTGDERLFVRLAVRSN